jgi:hypothetical protein
MVLAAITACNRQELPNPKVEDRAGPSSNEQVRASPTEPAPDADPAPTTDPAPARDRAHAGPIEPIMADDELKASPVDPVSTDDEPRHREIEAKALDEVVKRTNLRPEQLKAKAKRYGDDWHVSVEIVPATPGGHYFLRMSDSGDVDEFIPGA